MADQAPEIKVKLTAEDTGVASAIKQLGLELKNLKNQEDSTSASAINLRSAFTGLVAVIGTLRLASFAKDAFESAVNIGKMSDETGISTEALSVFHKTADDAGVSTEALDKALNKAAKSITQFEQGSKTAARGFQLLGISQKDFVGLNTDQKIELVADKLGKMGAGLTKDTAAQLIFSKGAAELIPVFNRLAAEGIDKATEATRRLGLLLGKDLTDSARVAKGSLQEVYGLATGLTTQFEAGLIPKIINVTEALAKNGVSANSDADAFVILGRAVGNMVAGTLVGFELIGSVLNQIGTDIELLGGLFLSTFEEIGRGWFALADAMTLHFGAAKGQLTAGLNSFKSDFADFWSANKSLVQDNKKFISDIFPSPEEQKRRMKELLDQLRVDAPPDNQTPPKLPASSKGIDPRVLADIKEQERQDEVAKEQASALHQRLQNELTIWQAYEKQREETEKESYDAGNLSTEEYYARRLADLKAETAREVDVLRNESKAAQAEAFAASVNETLNLGKAKKAGLSTKEGQAYLEEAARNDQAVFAALAKVQEAENKISTARIEGDTKALALEDERGKAEEANQKKLVEFQAQILEAEGRTYDAAVLRIQEEGRAMREELQKAGGNPNDAQALIDQKLADAKFEKEERITQQMMQQFEIEKKGIELAAGDRLITKEQEEKQINRLIAERLPLLKQQAQAELAIAQASNNPEQIAKAQQTIAQLQNIQKTASKVGVEIKGALTSDFQSFFRTLTSGTTSVGQAFARLGISIVQSLEQIAAQMLINFAISKLEGVLGLGGDGGAQKIAKTVATNDSIIISDAGVSGAAAFTSVMEALPFPANIAAAPAAMASSIAAVMSNLALGSAAEGALLNKDTFLQAHAEEMVLPPDLSRGLQFAINTGRFKPPSSETLSAPLSRSGDLHQNNEFHLHHTGDDARRVLEKELVPRIHEAMRKGQIQR